MQGPVAGMESPGLRAVPVYLGCFRTVLPEMLPATGQARVWLRSIAVNTCLWYFLMRRSFVIRPLRGECFAEYVQPGLL